MECEKARLLLSACLDGELDPAVQSRVQSHLRACRSCKAEYLFLERLSTAASRALADAPFNSRLVETTIAAIGGRGCLFQNRRVRSRALLLAACALAAVALAIAATHYLGRAPGRPPALAVETGDSGSVKRAGSPAWQALAAGGDVFENDVLKTGPGTLALRTPAGSELILNCWTDMQVLGGYAGAAFELIRGEVFARVNGEDFRILCDGASARVGGTSFSVRRAADRIVLTVTEGTVKYTSRGKTVNVRPGQQSVVAAGCEPGAPSSADCLKELEWCLSRRGLAPQLAPAPSRAQLEPASPPDERSGLPLDQPLEPPRRMDR